MVPVFVVLIWCLFPWLPWLRSAGNAMRAGKSPVVIDNTNSAAWEMKPYVLMVSDYTLGSSYRALQVWLSDSRSNLHETSFRNFALCKLNL